VIDQAIGIIMAQNRCSADDAFQILRRASMNRNVKIQQLGADMIRAMTGTDPSTDTSWNP
jgi:AmiR/NasT family two-component response regulator